jgi:protocatechuate 3,4-dioxygenase beta subunit
MVLMRFCSAQEQQECASQQQTPSDQLGPFYVSNSPVSPLMAPEDLLNDPSRRLEVRGRVLRSRSFAAGVDCNDDHNNVVGLAGVSVEMWYAGEPDADGNYYRNDEYRGQVVTDECGYYELVQTFPALYPTRPILHDHFRLSSSRSGQELLVTQMYFIGTDTEQGFVSADNTAREMQAVSIIQGANGTRSVEFDMYVALQEDEEEDGVLNGTSCQASNDSNTTDEAPAASIPVLEQQQQHQQQSAEVVGTTSSSIQSASSTTSSAIMTGKFSVSMLFMYWTLLLG